MNTNRWMTLLVAALVSANCGGEGTGSGNTQDNNSAQDVGQDVVSDASTGTNNVSDAGADGLTDADMGPRTLSDYQTCVSDSDCAVGSGTCLTEVQLNRPDANGNDRVALSDVFEGLIAGQGVCSVSCTVDSVVCEGLSVHGATSDAQPYVCQIVFEGDSPYPSTRPAFPFDAQMDPAELAAGVTFGAICRPPFQLDAAVDPGFCGACVGGETPCAGESVCVNFATGAAAEAGEPGTCLAPCAQDDCPMGFSCVDMAGASVCRPVADTCGDCRDLDGDGRGVGRCGAVGQAVTPVDCDDLNADAYFDPSNHGHAFPSHCGADLDYNCNGVSDETEQVGSAMWGDAHCGACGDTCSGTVNNGTLSCVQGECTAICAATHVSCDGDPRNGCEQEASDTSRIYYRDADGDTYGDASVPQFSCDPNVAPMGFVDNNQDCNDMSAAASPVGMEVCDGLDNDCNMAVDDGVLYQPDGSLDCAAAALGQCAEGTARCDGANGWVCDAGTPVAETCNGIDDNCDGGVDLTNGTPPADAPLWFPDCDGDGYGVAIGAVLSCSLPNSAPPMCPGGTWSLSALDCNDDNAAIHPDRQEDCSTPGIDENCQAVDTDPADWLNARQYYYDSDLDGYSATPLVKTTFCEVVPAKYSLATKTQVDCDDNNSQRYPTKAETCATTFDDDCDGDVHDAATGTVRRYRDADGDGYGFSVDNDWFCVSSMNATERASYPVTVGGDCNDSLSNKTVWSNGFVYNGTAQSPGLPEICDSFDNDCDGDWDEGCPSTFLTGIPRDHGTYKGSPDTTSTYDCPSGKVMSGIRVLGKVPAGLCFAQGVFGIQLICTNPDVDVLSTEIPWGYVADNVLQWESQTVIGETPVPVGTCFDNTITNHVLSCGDTESMRGLIGRSGTMIDRLGPVCVERSLFYDDPPATMSLANKTDRGTEPQGATGGSDFRLECAANEVMKGVRAGFTGDRLTSIEPRCVVISLENKQ